MMPGLNTSPSFEALIVTAAGAFVEIAQRAIREKGRFSAALAGGSTPRPIYSRLSEEGFAEHVDWSKVHLFFGDERCVPPDDLRSNYRMVHEALLSHVPIPEGNVHRIRGEIAPKEAAADYENELRRFFGDAEGEPRFDLVWLGIGTNGHTASLFPDSPLLKVRERWVGAEYIDEVKMSRVTLTPVALNAAENVHFLVDGLAKAEIVERVFEAPYDPSVIPAQIIQPLAGQLVWLLDAPAASRLEETRRVEKARAESRLE